VAHGGDVDRRPAPGRREERRGGAVERCRSAAAESLFERTSGQEDTMLGRCAGVAASERRDLDDWTTGCKHFRTPESKFYP
jgi:hypothetical protein